MLMVYAKCCYVIFKKRKRKIVCEINTLPVFNRQAATMYSVDTALTAWLWYCCCCCLYGFNWIVSCALVASIFRFIAVILSFFDKMFVALLLFQMDYYHFTALQFTSNIYITQSMMQSIYRFSCCCCYCYCSKDSQHQSFEVGFTQHMLASHSACHCSIGCCTHTRVRRWLCCQWIYGILFVCLTWKIRYWRCRRWNFQQHQFLAKWIYSSKMTSNA